MPRKSSSVAILGVDSLSVAERVLLFCVASDTDPIKAGVSSATHVMILKNCLERDQDGHLAITDFGSRVLKSLIKLNAEGARVHGQKESHLNHPVRIFWLQTPCVAN
jgi:hypothetical protein